MSSAPRASVRWPIWTNSMPDGEALFGVGTGSMVNGCSYARKGFALSCSTAQCTVKQDVTLFRSRPMHNRHHVLPVNNCEKNGVLRFTGAIAPGRNNVSPKVICAQKVACAQTRLLKPTFYY